MGFIKELSSNSVFMVFLIGCIGYLIGSIKIKGIEVGDAGVLLVALVAGHFGVTVPSFVNTFGIALFVGSVGLIAGPKFFHDFKVNAKSYVLLGFIIILTGAACAVVITLISGIEPELAAGLLSGALTSTPGYAAAQEAAGEELQEIVSVGYGIAYPFGVLGVVLFVQLIPKMLKADMAKEREIMAKASPESKKDSVRKFFKAEKWGMMPLCLTMVFGIILGKITIPLPGGASFSLGTSGGPLLAGLIIAHFGHIGPVDMRPQKTLLEIMRELGLILFLIAAGTKGGAGFVEVLMEKGPILFVYGVIMTLMPMVVGYFFAAKVLKLRILNNMGALCGGMTSTPALGTLIQVSGTDDVATSYASTYPIALVSIVLVEQFIILFL